MLIRDLVGARVSAASVRGAKDAVFELGDAGRFQLGSDSTEASRVETQRHQEIEPGINS